MKKKTYKETKTKNEKIRTKEISLLKRPSRNNFYHA